MQFVFVLMRYDQTINLSQSYPGTLCAKINNLNYNQSLIDVRFVLVVS